jgi:two-component system chemotaxis response regulator CheY
MKRCLIVDDSTVVRKVAKRILGGPDMLVVEAADGHEALSICAVDMPDIIVADYGLPDMDTIDLIRRMTSMHPDRKPHIVLCMIEFDVGAIMRAKRAGASGYILKPFDRAQLLESFRDMQVAA